MIVELDGDVLADEYAATRGRMRAALADLGPEEEQTVVPACPDWSVHDLVAHVTGIAVDLSQGRRPDGDTQAWVDRQIVERAEVPVGALFDEWDAAGPAFEAMIREQPVAFGGLLYDAVAHEHDARGALGRPGDRETDGVKLSVDIMANMVERDLRANDLGPVRISDGRHLWAIGEGEPELTLETTTWEINRLLGSRRSLAQMRRAPFEGDVERFVPGLCHLPLPDSDIEE